MGFWSKIKNAVKKAYKAVKRFVKAIARLVVRFVVGIIARVIGMVGGLFLFWLTKKMRVHICILRPAGQKELISVADAEASLQRATQIIKDKFDVKVKTYGTPYAEVIKESPPSEALTVECSLSGNAGEEISEGGEFFAKYLAGWNAIPISLIYPITVFVIQSITHEGDTFRGCSAGVFTDYVVLTPVGMKDDTTLAHEISHACSLLHRDDKNNLLFHGFDRGTSVTGWQKYWFRSSRHVNFW
jgi:hypothetical protein